MNGWSVAPLLMAGVAGSVAVHHAMIFVRSRRSTESLTFASMAACLAVYDVACAFLYGAESPAQGRPWQFVQLCSLTAGSVAMVLFAADYTRRRCARFLAAEGAAVALLVLAAIAGGPGALYGHEPQVRRVDLVAGLSVTYNEVEQGPVAVGLLAVDLVAFGYVFWAGVRYSREGHRVRARRLLGAAAVLFLASVNDLLLGTGLVRSLYVIEYAFLGMVLLMADSLSSDLVRAAGIEEALVQSEERFKRLAEAAFEGIGITERGRIVDVNPRLAEMLGYEASEMVGRPVMDFVAPESAGFVAGVLKEERGDLIEHLAIRKDGSVFPIETQGRALRSAGSNVRVAAVRDITERKAAERKMERQMERLRALRRIDACITSGEDPEKTTAVVLEEVVARLRVEAARVLLLDPASGTFAVEAQRGFRSGAAREVRAPLDGLAGWAVAEGRAVHVSLAELPPGRALPPGIEDEAFLGYHAVPLAAKGHLLGVLEVFEREELGRGRGWFEFLDTIAGQLAVAIVNRRLLETLERSHSLLAAAYDSTLAGWSRALELRDRETRGHSERVVELAVRLGNEMGMPAESLVHLRRGALLHDIGKMGIPDGVLLKPGPLTEEEWSVMRQHPRFALELLEPIEFLAPALDIPYAHHERWDGSGYPRGLAGEAIPLAARVFSVADAWDALRYERPYRRVWSEAEVRAYLREESGRRFDPAVVEVFLLMIEAPEASS
jgi:PAS domain S-box-containing protein